MNASACGSATAITGTTSRRQRRRRPSPEPRPLHSKIADLRLLGRRAANSRIEEWLDGDEITFEDLRYVTGFIQTRDRDAISNDWRASMAALFVAMPTLAVTVLTGFAPEAVATEMLQYTVPLLVLSGIGVLWGLTFMLIHTVGSTRSTRLLAAVEHRLEVEHRARSSRPTRRLFTLRRSDREQFQ